MTNRSRSIALKRSASVLPALAAALLAAQPVADATAADAGGSPSSAAERRVSAYLDSIREQPEELASFFRALPKGGELHSHLSGAASTELLMDLAVADGLCIENATQRALPPPCPANSRPVAEMRTDAGFRQLVLRAWSMQDFTSGEESGHDHFFATFGKFGEATWRHPGS